MRCFVLIAASLIASVPAGAADDVKLPQPVVTRHSGNFGGKRVTYDAVIEPVEVADSAGKPVALLVDFAYLAKVKDAAARPVLFIFNGGPISPSAMLHMGAFGPRRLAVPEDVHADLAQARFVDNEFTPLDAADLVFFDPANTGFSRTAEGVDPKSYFSVVADGEQCAAFVIAWSKLHHRELSPKYLIGESYGTMRAAQAANLLQKDGMPPAGVALLGQALNIIEYAQRPLNIVSYVVSLPTLASIAWSHGRADAKGRSFDAFIKDAQDFAAGDYLRVLFEGAAASADARDAVAARLAEFTGIPAGYYLQHALKITKEQYRRQLFPGQLLGLNDARYIGPDKAEDPFKPVLDAYRAALDVYVRDELGGGAIGVYRHDSPATGGFNGWIWGEAKSPFGDWPYGRLINEVMEKNPSFHVLVGNGYQDTQTTVGAMDYLVSQAGWPTDRVKAVHYQGGHMFYSIEASLRRLSADIRELIAAPH